MHAHAACNRMYSNALILSCHMYVCITILKYCGDRRYFKGKGQGDRHSLFYSVDICIPCLGFGSML